MIAQPAEGKSASAPSHAGRRPVHSASPSLLQSHPARVRRAPRAGTHHFFQGFALGQCRNGVDIKVKGVGRAHGAYRTRTKDPILVASHIVCPCKCLRITNTNPQDSAVVTVGSFKSGASTYSFSDEADAADSPLRSYDDKTRADCCSTDSPVSPRPRPWPSTAGPENLDRKRSIRPPPIGPRLRPHAR